MLFLCDFADAYTEADNLTAQVRVYCFMRVIRVSIIKNKLHQ
jgi:hypothetical protein